MNHSALPARSGLGIEHESFLCAGGAPANEAEFERFLEEVERLECRRNEPGKVSLRTPAGCEVIVSCDGYPHIVEVALAPCDSITGLVEDLNYVLKLTGEAAEAAGLSLERRGTMMLDREVELYSGLDAAKRQRFEAFIDGRRRDCGLSNAGYLAMACATQVTLDVPLDALLPCLPTIYEKLYLIPLYFSTSSNALSSGEHCDRLLLFRDNYPSDYAARLIPDPIPTRRDSYAALVNFPTFVRDYSFVSPRGESLVEMRPACSQPSGELVGELCALYLAIVAGALGGLFMTSCTFGDNDFWKVCKDGSLDPDVLSRDLHEIAEAGLLFPKREVRWLHAFLERASQFRLASQTASP